MSHFKQCLYLPQGEFSEFPPQRSNLKANRTMYQNLPSFSRLAKSHKNCLPANFELFGPSRSCTLPVLRDIVNIIKDCKTFFPSLSLQQLFNLTTIDQLNALVDSTFTIPSASNSQFYPDSTFQMTQLHETVRILATATRVEAALNRRLKYHHTIPSDNTALRALCNLKTLRGCISRKRIAIENALWKGLDEYPEEAEARLRVLLDLVCDMLFLSSLVSIILVILQP